VQADLKCSTFEVLFRPAERSCCCGEGTASLSYAELKEYHCVTITVLTSKRSKPAVVDCINSILAWASGARANIHMLNRTMLQYTRLRFTLLCLVTGPQNCHVGAFEMNEMLLLEPMRKRERPTLSRRGIATIISVSSMRSAVEKEINKERGRRE
jgi:hypothetical protein